ncbi:hypothetical protein ACQPX6_05920 [Actinomycetospora sp. CA-101289]|uniref:hypothetical protein n=1 Tax=Actinomycetospora sp. CA-101289 TaxID=3239893 RepID=UPI003D959C0E
MGVSTSSATTHEEDVDASSDQAANDGDSIATEHEDPAEADAGTARRLDETPWGRRLLTVFLLVTVVAIAVSVMPASAIRNSALTVAGPFLLATGLDQRWGVFAPNPRQDSSFVEARILDVDGTTTTWTAPPTSGVPDYWNYRWRKYVEQLWGGNTRVEERHAFATWLVENQRAEGRHPVRVELVRRVAETLPPGPGPAQGPWREEVFSVTTAEVR